MTWAFDSQIKNEWYRVTNEDWAARNLGDRFYILPVTVTNNDITNFYGNTCPSSSNLSAVSLPTISDFLYIINSGS